MVPVILNAGRADVRPLPRGLRRAGREGAHEHPHRRRPDRGEHHADQPRRPRHGRLGAAADGRPGHDRRDRLDRLPRRPGGHRRDDRRGEGHDDDLDLRPPHHPGGRVGALPGPDRGVPAGRARLLRGRVRGARRRARPGPRAPGAGGRRVRRRLLGSAEDAQRGPPTRSCCRRCRPRARCVPRFRSHGHLAARLDPLGSEPEGDPGLDPRGARPDARDARRRSRRRSCTCTCRGRRWPTRCRTCARPTAARSPTRSSTSPPTASGCGCARTSSPAPSASR